MSLETSTSTDRPGTKLMAIIKQMGFKTSDVDPADVMGIDWALVANDPADSGDSNAVLGIPDNSDQPSTVVAYRQIDKIQPTSELALGANDTWEGELMTFEGPYIFGAYQIRNSADATKYYNGWITNRQFNWNPDGATGPGPALERDADGNLSVRLGTTNWQQNVASWRPVWSATTGTFNGASLTDQGMMVAAQIPNQWTKSALSNIDANVPATGGAVSTVGFDTQVSQTTFGQNITAGPSTPQAFGAPTFQTVLQVSPGSKSWRSRDGWYLPLRYQDQTLAFMNTQDIGEVTIIQHPWNVDLATFDTDTLPQKPYPAPGAIGPAVTGVVGKRMRVGAVCFQGVAPTSTFSVHTRAGYEILAPIGSPWAANLTPSCPPSQMAVETYFRIRHNLPDVFPASYNKNAVLKKMMDVAVPAVMKVMPPTAQRAVKGVANIAGKVGGNSKLGKAGRGMSKRMNPNTEEETSGSDQAPQQQRGLRGRIAAKKSGA